MGRMSDRSNGSRTPYPEFVGSEIPFSVDPAPYKSAN